jgi:hypothetical protein
LLRTKPVPVCIPFRDLPKLSKTRVARWFILRPKNSIRVYFEGPRNGNVGIFYRHPV